MASTRTPEPPPDDIDPGDYQLTGSIDCSGFNDEQKQRAGDLIDWMVGFFNESLQAVIPKAIRYGSADLELMGKAMTQLGQGLEGVVHGQELAVWFYALGKIARLEGAYAQGELPDLDSWYDLFVYSLMAQRIRETGSW